MKYRKLGKTGLDVSRISFGALQLGRVPQKEVNRLIERALAGGMNYIDTARVYGDSEVKLGRALKGRRKDVILSTKVIKRDLNGFKRDYQVCLNNLQTDYIDILFIHDVSTKEDWDKIVNNGILDFMEAEKKAGRIHHIGCSTHSVDIGEIMLKTGRFEVVMLAYNPVNRAIEDNLLPLTRSLDIGVIIMKPFAGGILTEKGSKQLGFNITAEESLLFAASHPDVTTVIPGLDKLEYVETALKVADSPLELTAEEGKRIIKKVKIKSKYYCRGCGYCLPCPVGINIPQLLKLLNRWEAFKNVNWAQMHLIRDEYHKIDQKADVCLACEQCVARCPYNLPVPEMMKTISRSL
ncbi:MAG: uncharacterized protein PWR10_2356 [Halanaerobiales bacterium]|nr:uncharacterized protein [Halanaerobiales bacterium]